MVLLAAEPFHSWHQLSPKSLSSDVSVCMYVQVGMPVLGNVMYVAYMVYVSVSLCMCRGACLCWGNVVYAAYMMYVSVSMYVYRWTCQCDDQKKTLMIFLVLHSIPWDRVCPWTLCSRFWLGWLASELRTQACIVLNVEAVNLNSDP